MIAPLYLDWHNHVNNWQITNKFLQHLRCGTSCDLAKVTAVISPITTNTGVPFLTSKRQTKALHQETPALKTTQ